MPVVVEKVIGETPLEALETFRAAHPEYEGVPIAYAGRLDPMASGKLLLLIGEECKVQEQYHGLDKEYVFEVLLGVSSDTGDVLGIISSTSPDPVPQEELEKITNTLSNKPLSLPYPHFSSKTVKGKPLHTWTLEHRLHEIEVPMNTTFVYNLTLDGIRTEHGDSMYQNALERIDRIPPVTDKRKQLGADFRRTEVRASWEQFRQSHKDEEYQIATFTCTCSSGTYMRSLAEHIGSLCDTKALAFNIHRTRIGTYQKLPFGFGFWKSTYN